MSMLFTFVKSIKFLFISFCIVTICCQVSAEEFLELTDTKGRTINAKLIDVVGDKFEVTLSNGKKYLIKKEILREEDQVVLLDSAIKLLAQQNRLFDTEILRVGDGHYQISVTNKSRFDINDLRLEYTYFFEEPKNGEDIDEFSNGGSQIASIPSFETITFWTTPDVLNRLSALVHHNT